MENIATIYTYGGGEVLSLVFNAIAGIFASGDFKLALYIAAMLFGFWVLINSIAKNSGAMPFQWMFWFWIITNCILYPRMDVLIYDPITKHQQKVDNVPLVLGEFAAIVSGIGHGLTNLFETAFSLTDYQEYGKHGSVFASKILKNLGKYRIHDGTLKENMERFINQCVVLEAMMGGKYTVKDLQNSKDIWNLVSTNANPILGFTYRSAPTKAGSGEGQTNIAGSTDIVTCKAGAKLLETDLAMHNKEAMGIFGRQLHKVRKAMGAEQANAQQAKTSEQVFSSFFKTQLTSSYSFMSGMAEEADKLLRQEMMLNAIDDVKNNYAVSKAIIQQRAWHHVTGELASNFLVAMKVVLETLAYTSFVFVAMLVMLPSGLTILGRYLGLLMWLQLWAPLYAVLNLVMAIAARHQSQGILGDAGLTMLTSVGLANLHADIEAIAAMASASIPFISYAITQGGVGSFMHLASSLTSSLQGAASQSAAEVSSGNISMGNVSYAGRQQHMISGFKHDTSFAFRSGRMEMERLDGATNFMTPAGRLGLSAGAGINTSIWRDSINVGSAIGQNINANISRSQSELESLSHSYHNKQGLAFDQSTSLLKSAMQNYGQTQSFGSASNSQYRESFSNAMNFAQDLKKTEGYSETQTASVMAGLGMKMPAGAIANAEAQTGFSDQASYQAAVEKARHAAESKGVLSSIEEGVSHMSDIRFNGAKGDEQRLADNLGVTLNEMKDLSDQISIQRGKVKQWTDAKSYFENNSLSINQDVREELIDYIASKKRLQDGQPLGRAAAIQMIAQRTPEYEKYLNEFIYSKANSMAAEFAARTAPVPQTPSQTNEQGKAPEQNMFKFSAAGVEQQHRQEKANEKYNVNIANELQSPNAAGTFRKEMQDGFDTHLKDKGWENEGLKYGVETIDEDGNRKVDYLPVQSWADYKKHLEQKNNILPVEKDQKKEQPLSISPDFNSAEAKYRTYQEEGKPARDIINEVEAQSAKYQGQLKQQGEATAQRHESINKAHEAEANTSRLTKTLMGVVDYVDGFGGDIVKTLGGNYTTEKEKREASYRAGETTAFADLEAPQRPPSAPVVETKSPDNNNDNIATASRAEKQISGSDVQVTAQDNPVAVDNVRNKLPSKPHFNRNVEAIGGNNMPLGLYNAQQAPSRAEKKEDNVATTRNNQETALLNDKALGMAKEPVANNQNANSQSVLKRQDASQAVVSNEIAGNARTTQAMPADNYVPKAEEKSLISEQVTAQDKPVAVDNVRNKPLSKPHFNRHVEAIGGNNAQQAALQAEKKEDNVAATRNNQETVFLNDNALTMPNTVVGGNKNDNSQSSLQAPEAEKVASNDIAINIGTAPAIAGDNQMPKEEKSLISEHLSEAKPKVIKVQSEKFDSSAGMRANNGEQEQIKQMLREQGQLTEDVKRGDNDA